MGHYICGFGFSHHMTWVLSTLSTDRYMEVNNSWLGTGLPSWSNGFLKYFGGLSIMGLNFLSIDFWF